MKRKINTRQSNEVNAGSMADIAFLLLIFFLVTTTIVNDQGIMVKLPPYVKIKIPPPPIPPRNILSVKINKENILLVESEILDISQLKEATKNFILNPTRSEKLARSPKQAVVSLQNDRETSYKAYIEVYNELKAAYEELWNNRSLQRYGQDYDHLTLKAQRDIRNQIPLVISEAEPTNFKKNQYYGTKEKATTENKYLCFAGYYFYVTLLFYGGYRAKRPASSGEIFCS